MRAPIEARKPVEKVIKQARNIYRDSDTLVEYVKEITYYYSSEQKTREDILQQFYEDIKHMVGSYNTAYSFADPKGEMVESAKKFEVDYPVDKSFLEDMRGISEALHYLFWITSKKKLFLSVEQLEELGLRDISLENAISKITHIRSVYDAAIRYYIREGYLPEGYTKPVPDPPTKVLHCFQSCYRDYEDFYRASVGCSLEKIAENFYNSSMNKGYLLEFNRFKALYDFFVNPDKDSASYEDFAPKGKIIGNRQWRNVMVEKRKAILGE